MKQEKPVYQQTFDYLVTDYEWDGVRECLVEKPVKRDLFEEIQSNKDCALDIILDKFGGYPPVHRSTSTFRVALPYSSEPLPIVC